MSSSALQSWFRPVPAGGSEHHNEILLKISDKRSHLPTPWQPTVELANWLRILRLFCVNIAADYCCWKMIS